MAHDIGQMFATGVSFDSPKNRSFSPENESHGMGNGRLSGVVSSALRGWHQGWHDALTGPGNVPYSKALRDRVRSLRALARRSRRRHGVERRAGDRVPLKRHRAANQIEQRIDKRRDEKQDTRPNRAEPSGLTTFATLAA